MAWTFRVGSILGSLAPILAPFTSWAYLRKFSRKIAVRMMLLVFITPIIGYFRRPYIIREFNSQLQQQIQTKEAQMKQSLSQSNVEFASGDNNFQYMILVKSERKYEDQELFEKQKTLFQLNNQILAKSSQNDNYFEGIKFLFIGEQRIYQGLQENLPSKDNNNFEFIKKQAKQGGMTLPKPDTIQLIAKQANGDNKIIMEWAFEKDVTLKAIIRQISKHKHKKFVQSMNF